MERQATEKHQNRLWPLLATFATEVQAWCAVLALAQQGIKRDLVGLRRDEDGHGLLLSIQAPRARREQVATTLRLHGAADLVAEAGVETVAANAVPHPGVIEDHDLKLPAAEEYPQRLVRRPVLSTTTAPARQQRVSPRGLLAPEPALGGGGD